MINKIKLLNFPPFKEVEVNFKPITILAGFNDTGKSRLLYACEPLEAEGFIKEGSTIYVNDNLVRVEDEWEDPFLDLITETILLCPEESIDLSSVKEKIILLENPEQGLHPSLQSKLCKDIAEAYAEGKQIIIETHSDHIINGIRVAVAQKRIKGSDVQTNFFAKKGEKHVEIVMNDKGRYRLYPKGFMTQWDDDLDALCLNLIIK